MKEENMIYKFLRDFFEVVEDIFLIIIVKPIFYIVDLFSKNKSKK